MWEDPIVAEVRKIREEYAAQFGYDLQSLCRALKERELQDSRAKVSFPPRPARLVRKTRPATVLAEDKTSYEIEGDLTSPPSD
jgi:hypothetical protein